jgi:3'-phosphoadenosine 5'-phosphosulfate sulfotransferase (PAPS reductase)/FAD synthetase
VSAQLFETAAPQRKVLDAREILYSAIDEHQPRCRFVLFSGGGDSSVVLHWALERLSGDLSAAVYIDTGTALPGVREHAESYCAQLGVPLLIYEAGDSYERMCRRYGLPGPGAHRYAYVWLKERQLERLVREHKRKWKDRIMLISGVRASESERRMGTAVPSERRGAAVWVNPLIAYTDLQMLEYRERERIPQSDAAALMHRSGECNCGAFASPGEREMLQSLYPGWFARVIAPREAEAASLGLHCKWGERRPGRDRKQRLCHCDQLTLDAAVSPPQTTESEKP